MFTNVQATRLSNGVRVISSSIDHVESVAMGIWLGVGSRHEPRKLGGVSHFLEHLLFKGTPRRSALDISRAVEGRGGYLNAFTQEESTCYYARAGYDRMRSTFDVLADMVLHAECTPEDVEKERQVILEEMLMYRDQPHSLVMELLQEAIWPQHALGRPVIGCEQTISGMSASVIQRYKAEKYTPGIMVVAFAGRVSHAQCVSMAEASLAAPAGDGRLRHVRMRHDHPQTVGTALAREIEQTHLALGIRLFGRRDPRRYALRVLNTLLGENMSSRLFQTVREKYGLAYEIHSAVQQHADTGMLHIYAGLDRRSSDKALDLILKELDRFRKRPVGSGELQRAKDYMIGQLRLGLESPSHQMMWMGDNLLSFGHFVEPDEAVLATRSITAEEVRCLASEIFDSRRMSLAQVTPMMSEVTLDSAIDKIAHF